jgi:hypothetical protein
MLAGRFGREKLFLIRKGKRNMDKLLAQINEAISVLRLDAFNNYQIFPRLPLYEPFKL